MHETKFTASELTLIRASAKLERLTCEKRNMPDMAARWQRIEEKCKAMRNEMLKGENK